MNWHWQCDRVKCLHDNVSEVNDIYIGPNGILTIDLGSCLKCGNPHRFLKVYNQKIDVKHIGVFK